MKVIILTQFCCGCTVKTGSLIVGFIDMISSLIGTVIFIYELVKYVDPSDLLEALFLSDFFVNIVSFVLSMVLLYGIWKENVKCMLPWILFSLVYTVAIPILAVIEIVGYYSQSYGIFIEVVLISIITIAIMSYAIITVYSHYRNLIDNVEVPPIPPTFVLVSSV